MSISSISATSNTTYSSLISNDQLTQLEKQKTTLEKDLQEENQSKDDFKAKQQRVKQLQLQIQQVEAQIQQIKGEKPNQTSSHVPEGSQNDKTTSTNLDLRKSDNNMIDVQV